MCFERHQASVVRNGLLFERARMMKRKLLLFSALGLHKLAHAVSRFPKPDFESGYQYPEVSYAIPHEHLWNVVDVVLLVVLLGVVAWAVYKNRTRVPIIITSVISIAYFGFFRGGCVCSIGSIQNVALAMVDENYHLPWVVLLFFLIPIIFAFFFGRVFCAGVCPFGALQELVNVKSFRISKPIAKTLSVIPWIYLCFALLFAFTHSRFIICQFDPFIGIFRLGGDTGLIFFGVALLLMSVFTGRPFCRFLCPYGALLSLFSSVSIRKPQITQNQCVNCQLCHQSCPVDAVLPPYQNKVEEERTKSVWRVLRYVVVVPCLMLLGVFLMRLSAPRLSVANKEVRLYQLVMQQEANPDQPMPAEVEAFYAQGRTVEELTATNEKIQKDFLFYGSIAGAVIGWVIGVNLIRLTLRRTRKEYSIDARHCVACGKCFSYCPSTKGVKS